MNKPLDFNPGPKLVLDHMVLYQLLSDPKFWQQVPAFAFMKRSGQEAIQRIQDDIISGKRAKPCVGCSTLRPILIPLLIVFGQHLAQLKGDSPEAVNELVEFIARKRKYRPAPIVVYYKNEHGQAAQVEV